MPDLFWKVHDRAQPFVLSSRTMHELCNQTFLLVSSSVSGNQLLCSKYKYKYKYFISHFLIHDSRKNICIYMADNNKVLNDVMT